MRWNGRIFEWVVARIERRDRCDLYHSALEVRLPEGRFVIEQAPAWRDSAERGVVAEGAVGSLAAGRFRLFRYEVRCWREGVIPDVAEAVASPQRLSTDPDAARRLLALVPQVPTPVWARDELGAARCGTRTRPSRGCSSAAASTSSRPDRRRAGEHRAGTPASSSRGASR